jgi:hypothetical protein
VQLAKSILRGSKTLIVNWAYHRDVNIKSLRRVVSHSQSPGGYLLRHAGTVSLELVYQPRGWKQLNVNPSRGAGGLAQSICS